MLRDKGFGGDSDRATPVPIPNTEVKPVSADGTWVDSPWESRTPPDFSHKRPDFGRAACRFPPWGFHMPGRHAVCPVRGPSQILGRSLGSPHAPASFLFVAPSGQVGVSPLAGARIDAAPAGARIDAAPGGARIDAAPICRLGGSVDWSCDGEGLVPAAGGQPWGGQRPTVVPGVGCPPGKWLSSRGAERSSVRFDGPRGAGFARCGGGDSWRA